MNLVTKIINGMYKKSKYNNTFKQMQESKLRIKSLDFIMKFIKNLSELVEKNVNKNTLTNEETKQRESNPLMKVKDNYEKIILSLDENEEIFEGIKSINLINWLLE